MSDPTLPCMIPLANALRAIGMTYRCFHRAREGLSSRPIPRWQKIAGRLYVAVDDLVAFRADPEAARMPIEITPEVEERRKRHWYIKRHGPHAQRRQRKRRRTHATFLRHRHRISIAQLRALYDKPGRKRRAG